MNPATRTLLQVHLDNAAEADHMFTTLMGEKVGPRKDFIRAEATQGAEPRRLSRRGRTWPRTRGGRAFVAAHAVRPRRSVAGWRSSSTRRTPSWRRSRPGSPTLPTRPTRAAPAREPGRRPRPRRARPAHCGRRAHRSVGPCARAPARRRCGWRAPRCFADERDVRLFALPVPAPLAAPTDPSRPGSSCVAWRHGPGTGSRPTASRTLWARGILAEPFRWAELEQLVYSPRVMERRLVGATLATLPHRTPRASRASSPPRLASAPTRSSGTLIGDAAGRPEGTARGRSASGRRVEPTAIAPSPARRGRHRRGPEPTAHRAWVVRDALPASPPPLQAELRRRLGRRPPDRARPSTSPAAALAARVRRPVRATCVPQPSRAPAMPGVAA